MSPLTVASLALGLFVLFSLPVWALLYAYGEDDARQREVRA